MDKSWFLPIMAIAAIVLLGFVPETRASQADLQKELQQYVQIFQGDNFARQRQSIDTLAYSGIDDAALYDVIAAKLMANYLQDDKQTAERASWFAKALALSGKPEYKPGLETVIADAKSKKVRKHTKTALQRIDQYQRWNPVISRDLSRAPPGQLAQARVKNMLDSTDPQLVTLGAKRVYYAHYENASLIMRVGERLQEDYQAANSDHQIDAIAWLIKAVAQSGEVQYKPVLIQIAESANNKKIAKYAKKYAAYL